jgi:hypothetical protein
MVAVFCYRRSGDSIQPMELGGVHAVIVLLRLGGADGLK